MWLCSIRDNLGPNDAQVGTNEANWCTAEKNNLEKIEPNDA